MKTKFFRCLLCLSCLFLLLTFLTSCKKNHTHSFGEWVALREATCTSQGIERRYCSCGEYESQTTDPLGHKEEWIIENAPTCTEKGNQNRMCTVCKTVFETKAIDAKGHVESEWIVKTPASCDQVGESFKICTVCGAECDRKKDVVNHLPGPIITETEASCTQEGKKCQYCLYCQKLLGSKAIPKTEHVYVTENGQTLCKNCKEPKD